jgi:glycosyltransferase involved in cell wall biosynthesis
MPTPADAIIAANPDEGEARAQAALTFARLAQSPRPKILLVTHGRGGGVARHVRELAGLLEARAEVLVLRPHRRSFVALEAVGSRGRGTVWFHASREWAALVGLLRDTGLARVHYHHVHGLPAQVLDLAREAGCPWDVTLHDYYPMCPQYQLTDASGRYCGEPDEAGCTRCLAAAPAQWPMGIAQWRDAFARLLGGATRVIAPSQDAARRIKRHFPGIAVEVWPHGDAAPAAAPALKVLVLGGVSPSKGMHLLEACARDAKRRGLPLRFRVLGHVAWPTDGESLPLSYTGEFAEGELPALLEQERGDAIFFPAQWPETWSYTLSDALASGLPILAPAIGAFMERLDGVPQARTVAWDAGPEACNDALLAAAALPRAAPPSPVARTHAAQESYANRYLEEVRPVPAALPNPAVAPPGAAVAPDEALPRATLVELFDDGVRCGNGRSLAELRARMADADAALAATPRLADAEDRLAQAQSRLQSLADEARHLHEALRSAQAETGLARARIGALETSTSWRMTAPLRALVRRFRR